MLNFTEDQGQHTEAQVQVHRAEVPAVQERASFTPVSAPAPETTKRRFPTNPAPASPYSQWEALRDYVIGELERIAPFPRDPRKENTTFMGFQDRWGDQAMAIAVHAFEQGGVCLGAPLSVARFEKISDRVFAARIAEQLA